MIPYLFKFGLLAATASGAMLSAPLVQDQLGWGRAQQLLAGQAPAQNAALDAAVTEWKSLRQSDSYPFENYARFLLAHPGWPGESAMRRSAERALAGGNWSPTTVISFFQRFPPLGATGGAAYATALNATGQRDAANAAARKAWVTGVLSPTDEGLLLANFAGAITPADQDARMDELLWQGATTSAQRQIAYVSPAKRAVFEARLAFRTNAPTAAAFSGEMPMGAGDPGYIADRATWLRNSANAPAARAWLARPRVLANRPGDVEKWFEVLLANAREAANDGQSQLAYDIASKVDDAFPPGTDIGKTPLGERDDYTSLVWLAGQTALKKTGRPGDAIGMFDRYARGSATPQSQSKGYYWAGRAAEAAGRQAEAQQYLARAAGYRDLYYGQLAIERLGRPLVAPGSPVARTIDPAVRSAFFNRETVKVAQYLGLTGRWEDQSLFVRQIAIDAKSDSDHTLATELSRQIGRPDLGVMVGRSAAQNGLTDYTSVAFPQVRVPDTQAANWTMIHAIARQESQFDRAAVSHAGARGLMQLMPATARETAGKLGLAYDQAALMTDTDYNISLGSTYFQRIYNLYGSFPLAVAAYNAGPGNVNKWLRANGDPRSGTVDVVDWVEAIPIQETRNYVQRVLENAVVYDLMNPSRARSVGATNKLSWYLGKGRPG